MVGSHVTKSARTPKLIDIVVKATEEPIQTKLIEIKTKQEFVSYTNSIANNPSILGCFVTNPWKEVLEKCRKNGLVQTDKQGIWNAYNLILREDSGLLKVYNTDGIALVEILKRYNANHVSIIGNGAMARLTRDILMSLENIPSINIFCRNPRENDEIPLNNPEKLQKSFDISDLLINATPCGSPGFNEFPVLAAITNNNKDLRILDYVHTHENNRLRERCTKIGLEYTSGIELNNRQAFYGLKIMNMASKLTTYNTFMELISNEQ